MTFFYSGEMDGVYQMQANGSKREMICNLEKAKKILKDKQGTL